MKSKLPLFSMFALATVALSLSSCTTGKESAEAQDQDAVATAADEKQADPAPPQFQVDAVFQQQLAEVFSSYVTLKDAFVATDAAKVKPEAAQVGHAVTKVDMTLLSGAAHNDWMNYLSGLEAAIKTMQGSDDIEVQREAFKSLSENLYKSIKAYGLGGTTAFYDYCPMAFNNTGAYWLSSEEKILNPYFGDKMLTCGSVEEKLK